MIETLKTAEEIKSALRKIRDESVAGADRSLSPPTLVHKVYLTVWQKSTNCRHEGLHLSSIVTSYKGSEISAIKYSFEYSTGQIVLNLPLEDIEELGLHIN